MGNIFYPEAGCLGLLEEIEVGVWILGSILLPVGIVAIGLHP